jgi:hypothetical protein
VRIPYPIVGEQVNNKEITIYNSGIIESENRYMPWGEVRYTIGTMPTDYTYTGQKNAPDRVDVLQRQVV